MITETSDCDRFLHIYLYNPKGFQAPCDENI